jgi:hypothetical protein
VVQFPNGIQASQIAKCDSRSKRSSGGRISLTKGDDTQFPAPYRLGIGCPVVDMTCAFSLMRGPPLVSRAAPWAIESDRAKRSFALEKFAEPVGLHRGKRFGEHGNQRQMDLC